MNRQSGTFYSLMLSSGRAVSYELVRSKVKNINLRIYPDGRVRVSASSRVTRGQVEIFLREKEKLILKALRAAEERSAAPSAPAEQPISETQKEVFRGQIREMVEEYLPRFTKYGIARPAIGFRDMRSRWGSCCQKKGWVHFSYRLLFAPRECAEYVVVHELAHLTEPNHSSSFYRVVEEIMPDWRERKEKLKG